MLTNFNYLESFYAQFLTGTARTNLNVAAAKFPVGVGKKLNYCKKNKE